jgi:hypothetical protein
LVVGALEYASSSSNRDDELVPAGGPKLWVVDEESPVV